jgi:hypothetical protein
MAVMDQFSDRYPGWATVSRIAAAVLGGYGLSSAWVVLWGGMQASKVEAILAGVQTSFVLYVAAVIWAFAPVPLGRVWGVLLAAVAALLGAAMLLSVVWG